MTPIVSKARKQDVTLEDCVLPPDQTAEGEASLSRSEPGAGPSGLTTPAPLLSPLSAVAYDRFAGNWASAQKAG